MFGLVYDPVTHAPVDVTRYTETTVWDRRSLGAAITAGQTINYFTREGGTDLRDTNMTQASMVPSGQRWLVTTIQVTPTTAINRADMVLLQDNGILRLIRQEVTVFEAPLQHTPAGAGIQGATNVTAEQFVSNGMPSPMSLVPFSTGIELPNLIPFRVELVFPDATTLSAARNVESSCAS